MKIQKLSYKPEYNYVLIGIASSDSDYRLSWQLANTLHTEFRRADDLKIVDNKYSEPLLFSVYEGGNSNDERIRLISNKGCSSTTIKKQNNAAPLLNVDSDRPILIAEYKQIDYFFLVQKNENVNNEIYFAKLKTINTIQFLQNLDIRLLKSREKLIF